MLTPDQKASAMACGSRLELRADPGAFGDLSGNPSESHSGPLRTVADAAAPLLDPGFQPLLDLNDGTLAVRFDEYVNATAADLSRVSLSPPAVGAALCASPIGLAGAAAAPSRPTGPLAVQGGSSTDIVIALTLAQKAAAAPCGSPVNLRAAPGAFSDLAWNPSAAIDGDGAAVLVTADTTPPRLASPAADGGGGGGPPPVLLNLAAGTLSLTFDEYIGAASSDPSMMNATNALGAAAVASLSGASARGPDGPTLTLALDPSHVADIAAANSSNGPVEIGIARGALGDVSGNAFEGANRLAASFSSDAAPPGLDAARPPSLNFSDGVLLIRFDEPVFAPSVNTSGIAVAPGGRTPPSAAAPVPLGGADMLAAFPRSGGDPSVVALRLTAAQKAMSLAVGSPAELRMSPGSVADLSLNAIGAGPSASAALTLVSDTAAPRMSELPPPPRLDLGDGMLSVRFDEHVRAASVNASRILLLPAGQGPPPPGAEGLGGGARGGAAAAAAAAAEVVDSDSDSDAVRLRLTADQKAAVAGAQRVWLEAGALSDLSGNPVPESSAALSVARDTTAPLLDSSARPVLDMDRGTLTALFDEHIDASSARMSRLSIVDETGEHSVSLAGASLPPGSNTSVVVRLTPAQRTAALAVDAAPGPVLLSAEAGALSDLSGNQLAALEPVRLLVVADESGPAPLPVDASGAGDGDAPLASLDLGARILAIAFDEEVDLAASKPLGGAACRCRQLGGRAAACRGRRGAGGGRGRGRGRRRRRRRGGCRRPVDPGRQAVGGGPGQDTCRVHRRGVSIALYATPTLRAEGWHGRPAFPAASA